MSWWVVQLKPDRKAPYLTRCRDEDEADEKIGRAESEGLTAEKYHTSTEDIYDAKQTLRSSVAADFGETAGSSNYAAEE